MRARLEKDYVLLSIASGKHERGGAVAQKLRGARPDGGIPWMTILDGTGKELVTADGPKGNVGCPAQPHEIAWFRTMLERTCAKLQPADLDAVQKVNEQLAARWLAKKKG